MRKRTTIPIILLLQSLIIQTVSSWRSHRVNNQLLLRSCIIGTCCCLACIRVVSTGDQCLVERLGKFHRFMNPGLNFLLPLVENISFKDTLREQVLDVPPQECFTLDNAPLTADAIVYMRITSTCRRNILCLYKCSFFHSYALIKYLSLANKYFSKHSFKQI